jgi:hypothetical protein
MNYRKIDLILLALLLAGMAMVPMVSADEVRSINEIMTMKYLTDSPVDTKLSHIVPDTISDYALVTVDPKQFIKDADSQQMIECSISGKKYQIQLTEISLIVPDAKLYIKTDRGTTVSDLPRIKQYRGKVIGSENGDALFTVDDRVILAHISVDNESYFISQHGISDDGKVIHKVYNARNDLIRKNIPDGNDLMPFSKTKEIQDNLAALIPDEKSATKSTSTIGLLAVYDTQFNNAYPSSTSEIASMIASTNTAFSPSYIGVNIQINTFCWDSTLPSTTRSTLMTQLIDSERSLRDSTNSDLVFLFSGKEFSGNGIGYSGQYSYGVEEGSAYALAQMIDSGTSYTASSYQRPILIAHEMGHNFGAMHQTLESGMDGYPCYVPTYARAATWTSLFTTYYSAMYSGFQSGTQMTLEYSAPDTGHGDSSHNNALRINLQKATVAAYQ